MKINITLDVTKLEKERFFKGKKGIYCQLILYDYRHEGYNTDFIVKQAVTKTERFSGVRLPTVGWARILKKKTL